MVRIQISPLQAGIHTFALTPSADALDLDPDRFDNIEVDVTLDVQERRILAVLQARADATLECDRTLVLFQQPISGSYTLLFGPPALVDSGSDEAEDVRVLHPSDPVLDLTEAVRDTLLLAIPARCVAPGAETMDLPTAFGAPSPEEATDPRWEALRALREDRDGS